MKKTVLVTGGAGFIGSNFVRYLMDHYPDYNIVVVDQLTYAGNIDNLPSQFRQISSDTNEQYKFWYGNVCNAELINMLVESTNIVVHFAAESHVTRSIYDNLLFFETDVIGTHTVTNAILKASKNVERFVHISTSEVYGTALSDRMDEEHPLNPMSPYASAKCGADRLVYSYWQTYKIPSTIVRPFNQFGPFQHLEKVISRFITSGIMNEPMTVHGDGSAARDYVFVEDLCRAVDLILHAPENKVVGEIFNVSTDQHRSVLEIAQDVTKSMGLGEGNIKFCGDRPGQVFRHTGNSDKIRDRLGWKPQVTWKEGLDKAIEWYANNRSWWETQMWMRTIPIITTEGKLEYH
ncbi:MAG: GDP-mannose 4,6-dehydratase [Magnetococcales bacterium]|nr:GDP-mannose 4,6-dehydratase [Magnetococcales bacterium]